MQNVEMKLIGSKLVIEVDLSKSFGPSKSGKTVMVASTQGNTEIPGPAWALRRAEYLRLSK